MLLLELISLESLEVGKTTCWKLFEQVDNNDPIVDALTQLGATESILESTIAALEAYVCKLYIPETQLTNVADARWWLFKQKQAQAENMPPTRAELYLLSPELIIKL